MKIAIFCDSFFPTIDGVSLSIKNNTELFSKQTKLFFFIPSGSNKINNHDYIFLKSREVKNYKEYKMRIPSFFKVYSQLKKIKPDLIHVHSAFGIGWEGVLCARILKIPIISTFHTVIPEVAKEFSFLNLEKTEIFERLAWKYVKLFFNLSNEIITPSEFMKKELMQHGIKKPITVISNGINIKKFPMLSRKNNKTISFISIGRLVESKNVIQILKSFNIASEKNPNLRLIILGKGPEKDNLKRFVEKNNLQKKVKMIGFIDNEKIVGFLKKSDVFITASSIETEGISTLEAMSTGLPIIGANARATPNLIKNSGIIVPLNNPEIMAKSILELAENRLLRKKLGISAHEEAIKYNINKTSKTIYNFYKNYLKNNIK